MHKTPEGHPIDHIGDGVYVEWDGFALQIRVNDHRNPVLVTLEPFVLEALNNFYRKVTHPLAGEIEK